MHLCKWTLKNVTGQEEVQSLQTEAPPTATSVCWWLCRDQTRIVLHNVKVQELLIQSATAETICYIVYNLNTSHIFRSVLPISQVNYQ